MRDGELQEKYTLALTYPNAHQKLSKSLETLGNKKIISKNQNPPLFQTLTPGLKPLLSVIGPIKLLLLQFLSRYNQLTYYTHHML